MLKLLKSLKPFSGSIIVIFLLLLGQAMSDLTLPDMMSRIIDVGIQQNGIANSVPAAIRQGQMEKLFLLMSSGERDTIENNYRLIDLDSLPADDAARYLKAYPGLSNGPIYLLEARNRDDMSALDDVFSTPLFMLSAIESGTASPLLESIPGFPPGAEPFTALAQLSSSDLNALRRTAETKLADVPEAMITQSNVNYLASEYRVIGLDLNRMQTGYMLRIGGLMLLLTLASVSCSVAVGFLAARIAAGFGRNTRKKIFTRVENYSSTEFDKFSTASLITRSTNDITQIQLVMVMMLRFIFYAPIMGAGGIIKVLGQDVSMTWIIAAAVIMVVGMISGIFTVAIPKFRIIQKLVDRLNLVTREMLAGLMVVRAFNTQQFEENRFEKANVDLTSTTLFINRVMVFMMPAMMLIMNGVTVLIVWIGAYQIDRGVMQVGDMMAFMQYAIQIIMAFLMISIVFVMMPRATVSAQRIAEVLETESGINDPSCPRKYNRDIRGSIVFQNVGFKYPGADEYVLKEITFSAAPGQTTAIVGGTGCGKSTLVNLIPRFYDVTEGRILVDDIDIRDVTQHDLREKIGYIPQKASLFSGTIESNIAYGSRSIDSGRVQKAAEIAQLKDFLDSSEDGLQTRIAQGGSNISGGQKQRVAIARALAKRPEIYIFDDSFSAIDFKTDAALRKALKKEMADTSILIVAQRINTIMNSDQIIVLENGRMVGKGTHKELMRNCQVYQELALSQLSREELS